MPILIFFGWIACWLLVCGIVWKRHGGPDPMIPEALLLTAPITLAVALIFLCFEYFGVLEKHRW